MTAEEKPKIRWWTVALALSWVAVSTAVACVTPTIREMLEEMGTLDDIEVASMRLIVRVPALAYALVGLLVAAALVWKSRALPARTSAAIDALMVAALLAVSGLACHALSAPWWYVPVAYSR